MSTAATDIEDIRLCSRRQRLKYHRPTDRTFRTFADPSLPKADVPGEIHWTIPRQSDVREYHAASMTGTGHTRASGEQVSCIQKRSQSGHARARCEALR